MASRDLNFSTAIQGDIRVQDFESDFFPVREVVEEIDVIHDSVAIRLFDIVSASVLLVLLTPVFLIIGLAIRLTSGRKIFYSQLRVGRGGKNFSMFKFRTMIQDAHLLRNKVQHLNIMSGPFFKAKNDPRVTKVGRFLRKFSLDELPQLLNVLRGEMTLVGPRPMLEDEVSELHCSDILAVKPGITGLWQIRGRNEIINFEDKLSLDRIYIRKRSFGFNFYILASTAFVVFKGNGAY